MKEFTSYWHIGEDGYTFFVTTSGGNGLYTTEAYTEELIVDGCDAARSRRPLSARISRSAAEARYSHDKFVKLYQALYPGGEEPRGMEKGVCAVEDEPFIVDKLRATFHKFNDPLMATV